MSSTEPKHEFQRVLEEMDGFFHSNQLLKVGEEIASAAIKPTDESLPEKLMPTSVLRVINNPDGFAYFYTYISSDKR